MASNNIKSDDTLQSDDSSDEEEAKHLVSKSLLSFHSWDPLLSKDWDVAGEPNAHLAARFKRDIASLVKDPLPGIFAIPTEKNLYLVHCLILGPFETPYEGGFFHFIVRFGPSYPLHPPRVRLMTTDGGMVRFNPNLYADGKVCLSLLGTWSGPRWSPTINLGALLLSIQSLLCDKPFYNEPGFKNERYAGESENYNLMLTHETLRVAVCGQLENIIADGEEIGDHTAGAMPSELRDVIRESFTEFYDDYISTCRKHSSLDGTEMADIFSGSSGHRQFNFRNLIERLNALKESLDNSSKSTEAFEGKKED